MGPLSAMAQASFSTFPGLTFSCPSRQTHFLCSTRSANAFKSAVQPIKNPHHYRGEGCLLVEAAGIEPASVSPLLSALHA